MLLYLSASSFHAGCNLWQCPHLKKEREKKQILSQESTTVKTLFNHKAFAYFVAPTNIFKVFLLKTKCLVTLLIQLQLV